MRALIIDHWIWMDG